MLLSKGHPEIFNTDQGVQYTSSDFTNVLVDAEIQSCIDGQGRTLDNIFVERLWRTVKHEHIYLHEYETVESYQRDWKSFSPFTIMRGCINRWGTYHLKKYIKK